MEKIKKYLILLFLTLYFAASLLNFANASICFAKDHTGLEFAGMDSCCEKVEKTDACSLSDSYDCCEDVELSSDIKYQELSPVYDNCCGFFYSYVQTINFADIYKGKSFIACYIYRNKAPPNVLAFLDNIVLII